MCKLLVYHLLSIFLRASPVPTLYVYNIVSKIPDLRTVEAKSRAARHAHLSIASHCIVSHPSEIPGLILDFVTEASMKMAEMIEVSAGSQASCERQQPAAATGGTK